MEETSHIRPRFICLRVQKNSQREKTHEWLFGTKGEQLGKMSDCYRIQDFSL